MDRGWLIDTLLFLRGADDDGSLTDAEEGGSELKRDVLLLLLFDTLGVVVREVDDVKAEYGEDEADKHVNLRFIADDILLPIEPMFRIPSSIE